MTAANKRVSALLTMLMFVGPLASASPGLNVEHLQVNFMTAPRGVDRLHHVHFSWQLPTPPLRGEPRAPADGSTNSQSSPAAGDRQLAAHDGGEAAGELMIVDVARNATVFTAAATLSRPELALDLRAALKSDTLYAWRVHGSQPATFSTGLLAKADWRARWIRGSSGPQQCRSPDFVVKPGVVRATLVIAACQYFTVFLDGKKLGKQAGIAGPWTSFYNNRSYITLEPSPALLGAGQHTLGVRIGQGFCTIKGQDMYDADAERSAIVQLQLHGASGVMQTVASGASWTCGPGPITSDSTYFGESYDARLETPGWASPGFAAPSGWKQARTNFTVVAQLNSQGMPSIEAVKELSAVSVNRIAVVRHNSSCSFAPTDGQPTQVACSGNKIKSIGFFSWGTPSGSCAGGGLRAGTCASTAALLAKVKALCVGQETCEITCRGKGVAPHSAFCIVQPGGPYCPGFCKPVRVNASDPCVGVVKHSILSVACEVPPAPPASKQFKYVFDFGQEFAGVVRLTLPKGMKAGTRFTLKHAETLT